MGRATIEVADIFRRHGPPYRAQNRLLPHQHRLMRAIERCRTAALGGHVERCGHCSHKRIRYNSCLMGSNSLWGVGRQKGMPHVAVRPFDSPLSLALQQGEQFVRRPELALAKARRHNRLDGLQLFGRVSANIDFRRGQIAVPQP
jgi:hypothetical protein